MDQLGLTIDTNMALHAKVPFVAFLGLVHLWITLAFLVFGRGWRINDGCIHNRASADFDAELSLNVLSCQIVFQKITSELLKTPNCFIWRRLATQIDSRMARESYKANFKPVRRLNEEGADYET